MKNAVRKFSNQKGFSLIEVMIATAILSVVMAGTMEAMRISMLQVATSEAKNAVVSVSGYVGQIALEPTACTAAITKVSQNYGTSIRFDLADGQVIADLADMPNHSLFVKSFTYSGATLVSTGYDGTKAYFGTLFLTLGTKRQLLGPSAFRHRAVASIYITVGPTGKIVACGATLPTLPTAPVATLPLVAANEEFRKGCSAIGGEMSNGSCTIHSGGTK